MFKRLKMKKALGEKGVDKRHIDMIDSVIDYSTSQNVFRFQIARARVPTLEPQPCHTSEST